MKVYISLDMEGVGGVVASQQVPDEGVIPEVRELATREVNAAVEGAVAAGAVTIYVNDTHPKSRNLIPELLDPRVEYISGFIKPLMTLQDINETFDAVFLLGLHTKAGDPRGVLSHTWLPKGIIDYRVNGVVMGEVGLNALLAGHYGVPVVLVTGDQATCDEALDLLGDIETVAVKIGIARYAARCLHPSIVRERISEAATRALRRLHDFKPFTTGKPITLEMDLSNPMLALWAANIPGTKLEGPRRISFTADDFETVQRYFIAATFLMATVEDEIF